MSIFHAQTWVTLVILTLLEIVLGIDNLVFITIASSRLPLKRQPYARKLGLSLAVITRLLLLAFAFWLIKLVHPLFYVGDFGVSARDLLLIIGGLFLIYTAIKELVHDIRREKESKMVQAPTSFFKVICIIMVFDILFSLDSVITAVGVANEYWIMATAIIIAIIFMIFSSDFVAHLIRTYWRIRLLALCFLILVGIILLLHGLHFDVPKAYLFAALFFSIFVEIINSLYEKFKGKNKV